MRTLYLERSTGECRSGDWVEKLDLEDVGRIVVGQGPGSFAGVRSALAFAQGYALGRTCEVFGLPSPCATAGDWFAENAPGPLAVVGDARQGMFWIALFDGCRLVADVFQVTKDQLALRVPMSAPVVSPDDRRIGSTLKELFADNYKGERLPTTTGLERYEKADPSRLVREPLPIYLNPAVRT